MSKSAIYNLVAKAKNIPQGEVPPQQSVPGCPRKTLATADKLMKRQVLINPCIAARQLLQTSPTLIRSVAECTVQEHCQKHQNLPLRSLTRKPLLTRKMHAAHLSFTRNYKHFAVEDWKSVLWSDELTFQCGAVRCGKLRHPSHMNPLDPCYVQMTVVHADSAMIWGCFSGELGHGGFHVLPKNITMNGDPWIEVLHNHMMSFCEIHGCNLFMQDSTPCREAKVMK